MFFEAMTDSQKDLIANNLIVQNFKQGEQIIAEGDQASSYYIIKQGSVECVKDGKPFRVLKEGESFGENALFQDGKRSLTVRAAQDCLCLSLSRDALQEILGAKIQEVIQGNWSRWAIEKNPMLSKLTKLQIEKWVQNATIKKVPQGTVLLDKNSTLTEIFIVLNGELKCGQSAYSKGTVFDDRFLYPSAKLKSKIGSDLIASEESEISVISTVQFFKLLGGSLEVVFVKNLQSHENKLKDDDRTAIKKKFENMKLSELIFIKKLGEGQFGHVFLVKNKVENELYALKGISKHQIAEQKLERHTRQEKDVLEKINFPFLLTMYRTFKDDNFVYFLLGFVQGMELFEAIRQMGRES
jgi:cGMP-dependent protein kinase